MPEKSPCIVAGCPNFKPHDHAMCRPCWRQVPRELQRAVYRAWRERGRDYPGADARHLQALEDAAASVEGREPEELFA